MKNCNIEDMPVLANSQAVSDVTVLQSIGANTSVFGLHLNDEITFDVNDAETGFPVVKSREVRPGSSAKAYYVACTRNGQPSWVSTGALVRRDFSGKYISPVGEELASQPSFLDMFKSKLADKTIVVTKVIEAEMAAFDQAGNRLETPRKQQMPYIEWK